MENYITTDEIIEIVSSIFKVSIKDIKNPYGEESVIIARHVCMYCFNKYLKLSLSKNALVFLQHYSTCFYAIKKIHNLIDTNDKEYYGLIMKSFEQIRDKIVINGLLEDLSIKYNVSIDKMKLIHNDLKKIY